MITTPLRLPCGAVLSNRIAKAAMTEGLADAMNRATARHVRLYERWSGSGAGLLLTGNVQVDRRYLERPNNVAIDGNGGHEELRAYARAGTARGHHLWMQLSHAGRQTPIYVHPEPVAPSAVPLDGAMKDLSAKPRALSEPEILDVVRRFAHAATVARETGFTGVQIHAAHGYLLSEFLSPLVNRRTDAWGGSLENRARLLLEVVRAVRSAVGHDYPLSVKLNSADFQHGGFSVEESTTVARWLDEAGIDLLELSGGTYERPAMVLGVRSQDAAGASAHGAAPQRQSTLLREAYFLSFAEQQRAAVRAPVMVTGGFRTRAAMTAALAEGKLDVVGIARPFIMDPECGHALLSGALEHLEGYDEAITFWFYPQLMRLGDGLAPDPTIPHHDAIARHLAHETAAAAALVPTP